MAYKPVETCSISRRRNCLQSSWSRRVALIDAGAHGWREQTVDPYVVRRIMEERRQAVALIISYLDRWPHV